MANAGKNTNGSQFFILLNDSPHLDGKHVVFGNISSGGEFLDIIESAGSQNGKTKTSITIVDCGELV